MARSYSEYICQQCGYKSPSFLGRCPECGEWNSLVESKIDSTISNDKSQIANVEENLFKLSEIKPQSYERISSGFSEFDRVLGGGIVPGSIVLVSGDPGIGKSTLLLDAAIAIAEGAGARGPVTTFPPANARSTNKKGKSKSRADVSETTTLRASGSPSSRSTPRVLSASVLYVCGEESPQQVKMRAERTNKGSKAFEKIFLLPITSVEEIVSACIKISPSIIIVDSIQTLTSGRLTGSAGTVGQVRECAQVLQVLAKKSKIPILLVGHVTKEGSIAGPKVLEHLVDAVLNLEGDGMHAFRILRSVKNRFGSTSEVGVFEMADAGMREVKNPSEIFLSGKVGETAGSVVCASMAGGRPILVEVQALTTPTIFGIPTRRVTGLDFSRAQLVIASLSRAAKIPFANLDVYLNVAGGLKLSEPAVDLAMALALASAARQKPLKRRICTFGEVGLLGELRSVGFVKNREAEAKRQGFADFVTPEKHKRLEQAIEYAIGS